MTYFQATVFGAIQGLAEFLPISSSAHLILAPWLLRWEDPGLAFDVALHMGTLAAIVAYFYKDWLALFSGALKDPKGSQARLLCLLAAATIPGGLAGLALEKQAESLFRDPLRIAVTLIAFGVLLELADRLGRKEASIEETGAKQALGIGLAQALAIVPGVSRSGITMTAALALGLSRDAAARFSFLLATPIILGAGLHKMRHIQSADVTGPFLWAIAVSALTGLGAVHFFLSRLRRSGLWPYALYRVAVGAAILACAAAGLR